MDRQTENFNPAKIFKPQWIKEKIDNDCVDFMDNMGEFLAQKEPNRKEKKNGKSFTIYGKKAISTSQLRNVFSEIKRIELKASKTWNSEVEETFQMLRPTIAYNTARVLTTDKKSKMEDFKAVLDLAHREVTGSDEEKKQRFRRFLKLVEGIIAYHKVYESKNSRR